MGYLMQRDADTGVKCYFNGVRFVSEFQNRVLMLRREAFDYPQATFVKEFFI